MRKRGAALAERRSELSTERLAPSAGARTVHGSGRSAIRAPFRYLCVLDVEATCKKNNKNFVHEIIEFPVVVIDLHEGGVFGEFHTYVRPTTNSTLSAFCTQLTGITQEQVDSAPTLEEVLAQFETWRVERGLVHTPEQQDFAFAADGPWDLRFFLHAECARKGIGKEPYYDKWVNVKTLFADFYRTRSCKIHRMLELQGMRFEGRLHSGASPAARAPTGPLLRRSRATVRRPDRSRRSPPAGPGGNRVHGARSHPAVAGIDDTRNIARIAARMVDDGCGFYLNEGLTARERAIAGGGAFENAW